jgi:hypothetical protein
VTDGQSDASHVAGFCGGERVYNRVTGVSKIPMSVAVDDRPERAGFSLYLKGQNSTREKINGLGLAQENESVDLYSTSHCTPGVPRPSLER